MAETGGRHQFLFPQNRPSEQGFFFKKTGGEGRQKHVSRNDNKQKQSRRLRTPLNRAPLWSGWGNGWLSDLDGRREYAVGTELKSEGVSRRKLRRVSNTVHACDVHAVCVISSLVVCKITVDSATLPHDLVRTRVCEGTQSFCRLRSENKNNRLQG